MNLPNPQIVEKQTQGEWTIMEVDGLWLIVPTDIKTGEPRAPTKEEAQAAANLLNEASGSSVVNLYCRTEGCADKGGFITRTTQDANKQVYGCDTCKRPMVK